MLPIHRDFEIAEPGGQQHPIGRKTAGQIASTCIFVALVSTLLAMLGNGVAGTEGDPRLAILVTLSAYGLGILLGVWRHCGWVLKYSLRSMLVAVTATAIALGLTIVEVRRQIIRSKAMADFHSKGGSTGLTTHSVFPFGKVRVSEFSYRAGEFAADELSKLRAAYPEAVVTEYGTADP